jgi:hypothetical protein
MVYPAINSSLASENLAYFFIYAQSVTHDFFSLFLVGGFFLIVFVGSIFMQLRFTTRIKPETSLLASSFATLGFAIILEQYSGILSPIYFFIIVGILILSLMWNVLSR